MSASPPLTRREILLFMQQQGEIANLRSTANQGFVYMVIPEDGAEPVPVIEDRHGRVRRVEARRIGFGWGTPAAPAH